MIKANDDVVEIKGNGKVVIEELNNIIRVMLRNSPETVLGVLAAWTSELNKATSNIKDEQFFNRVASYSIKHNREVTNND